MTVHDNWEQLNGQWPKIHAQVFRLQKRIYKASRDGKIAEVRQLQRLLLKSYYARLVAVKKVTTDNQGKKTAGIDGKAKLNYKERLELVHSIKNLRSYRAKPVRRVDIPKPDGTKRHLGIPTMRDRAIQTLVLLALEPEWEAKFEPNSYGFRKGRSTMDAIKQIWHSLSYSHKWIIDADISKCFDNIDQDYLLKKLELPPMMRRLIRSMLKSGVVIRFPDGHKEHEPTDKGTPQGGAISPLLANIALHGLETYLTDGLNRCNVEFIPITYPQCPVRAIKAKVSNDPVFPQCPVKYLNKEGKQISRNPQEAYQCIPRLSTRWSLDKGTTKLRDGALPYTHSGKASIYSEHNNSAIKIRKDNRANYDNNTGTILPIQGAISQGIICQRKQDYITIKLVRYADDFIAIYKTKEETEEALQRICEILAEIGLEINQKKTRIVSSREGFDFLGFNVRTYETTLNSVGIKCIIEPSKANIKRHYKALKEAIIRQSKGEKRKHSAGHLLSASQIIKILNPKIRGWCNYYRHVNSSKAFERLNYLLFYRLYKWAYKKYGKTYKGCPKKFAEDFKGKSKRFHDPKHPKMVLKHHTDYKIDLDYVKIRGNSSPYDGNETYWLNRAYTRLDPMTGNLKRRLFVEQNGSCKYCGEHFKEGDLLEVHHTDQNRQNNQLKNLELLHRHCHDERHRETSMTVEELLNSLNL